MKADTDKEQPTFRIIELRCENIKRLTAVQLKPGAKGLVVISGRNGAGKSSLFDAILWSIQGRRAMPAEPIRRGADKALAEIDLGDIIVRRELTRTESGSFESGVKVYAKDGSAMRSPQAVLDAMFGAFTFDPGDFLTRKPAEQTELLKSLVPGVDFKALAAQHDADYAKRTDVGRERDRLKAYAKSIVITADVPEALDGDEVDAAALSREHSEAMEHNRQLDERLARRDAEKLRSENYRDEAERLRAKAAELEQRADEIEHKIAAAGALPDRIDTTTTLRRLGHAATINTAVRQRKEKETALSKAADLTEEYDALTNSIDRRKAGKLATIAAAKLPVPGLGFDDRDNITLNGFPFEQAPTSAQLRCALAIGMAMNPGLRAIFIREGSFFDKASLALINEVAEDKGWQVWIERVAEGPEAAAFYLEDGSIKQETAQ